MSVDTQTEAWLANREERRHDDDVEPLDRWDRQFEDRD